MLVSALQKPSQATQSTHYIGPEVHNAMAWFFYGKETRKIPQDATRWFYIVGYAW